MKDDGSPDKMLSRYICGWQGKAKIGEGKRGEARRKKERKEEEMRGMKEETKDIRVGEENRRRGETEGKDGKMNGQE